MSDYKALRTLLVDGGGGEKYIPHSIMLDLLEKRVSVLNNEIGKPHLSHDETEFRRGLRWEVLSLMQALKDREPGTVIPTGPIT
jgi:hypothetical protein